VPMASKVPSAPQALPVAAVPWGHRSPAHRGSERHHPLAVSIVDIPPATISAGGHRTA
jgi:hypothetical protein